MKSQRAIFKWIAIPIILAVFLNSALVLPSASAQDEFTPTPTQVPTDISAEPTATEIPPEATPTESATPVPTATEEESAELAPPLVPAEAEPAIQLFSQSQPSGSAADNLLAGGDSIQSSPALAYNSVNREYLVVWVDNAEPASLRGRIVSEASVAIAEEFVITPGIVSTPTRLEIIYNSAENTYLVLWSEPNGLILGAPYYALAAHNLYVLQLASDGTPVSASPTLISNQVTFFPNDIRLSYAIAYNSNGNEFLVAWVQPPVAIIGNVAHPHRVMGQRLGPDGTLRGGKVTWKAGVTSSIALAYSPASNEYLVTWDRWFIGSSGYDLFAQRIRPDTLAVIGSDIALGTGPGWQSMAALTYAASTNDYFVTWMASPLNDSYWFDIVGRRVHAGSGTLVGPLITILHDTDLVIYNDVAYSAVEDRFLVSGKLPAKQQLIGRYVTPLGEMPEETFQITTLPLDNGQGTRADFPRIAARSGAVDGAPNFVAAWKTNDDIYARAIGIYDCSGYEPATAAGRAVLGVLQDYGVQSLNYCQNQVENAIFVPASNAANEAFKQWADLASSATHEVAFTVMFWDERDPQKDEDGVPYPGEIVLQGVKDLYNKVTNPLTTGDYPSDVTVRILLGVQKKYVPWTPDQRYVVLDELKKQRIPNYEVLSDGRVWKVEVALYREGFGTSNLPPLSTGKYSHVKLMVVDNHKMIVSGYHPQYNFGFDESGIVKDHDLGLEVSGPIAANGMAVFDSLWSGSEILCTEADDTSQISNWENCHKAPGEIPTHLAIAPVGNDIVLPLYRDHDQKAADQAVQAAIEAANTQVYVLQNRFVLPGLASIPWPYNENGLLEYADALLNIAPTADIRILVSRDPINLQINGPSIENFLLRYYLAGGKQVYWDVVRFYAPNGGVGFSPGLHSKAFMIDGEFLVIGSQNFDQSAFGNNQWDLDLAEYSLGIENIDTVSTVKNYLDTVWQNSISPLIISPDDSLKTSVEQATPGAVIIVEPGVYEITSTVTIPEGVTLVGLGATLKPAATFSTSLTGTFKLAIPSFNSNPAPLLRINGSSVTLMGLTIQDSPGYAIEIGDGGAAFENVYLSRMVFANNTLGGVHVQSPANGGIVDYTIENNTFVGGDSGVTLMASATTTANIRNNIFIGQLSAPVHILSAGDGQVEYSFNLFSICGSSFDCATNWKIGNLAPTSNAHDNLFNLDPQFMDPVFADYSLSPTSPLIDAGDPDIIHEFIFDGDGDAIPRIDIGAFESFLTTDQLPPLADDVPNLPGMITELTGNNTNLRYYINPTGDEDWFRFYLPEAGNPQIHLTSLPANYDLYVYNAAGQLLGSSTKDKKAAEMVKLNNAIPGYYYVRVVGESGAWDANNPYQLRFNVPGGK